MPTDDEEFIQEKNIQVIYVDTFRIGYDAYKFVFDLGLILPADETPQFTTKIIMAPDFAKSFVETLGQSIKEFPSHIDSINVKVDQHEK